MRTDEVDAKLREIAREMDLVFLPDEFMSTLRPLISGYRVSMTDFRWAVHELLTFHARAVKLAADAVDLALQLHDLHNPARELS